MSTVSDPVQPFSSLVCIPGHVPRSHTHHFIFECPVSGKVIPVHACAKVIQPSPSKVVASCWHHVGAAAGDARVKLRDSGLCQVRGERCSSLPPCSVLLLVSVAESRTVIRWAVPERQHVHGGHQAARARGIHEAFRLGPGTGGVV